MPNPFSDDDDENENGNGDDDDDYSDGNNNDDDGGEGHFISLGVCPVPSAFGNVLLKSCIWGQKSRNLHCEHITFSLNGRKKNIKIEINEFHFL